MLYFLYQVFIDDQKTHVAKCFYLFITITAIITVISVTYKRYTFLDACEKLSEIDNILEVKSYKLWVFFSSGMTFFLSATYIVYIINQLMTENKQHIILLRDYGAYTVGFVIHIYAILIVTTFIMMVRERYQRINQIVENLDTLNSMNMLTKSEKKDGMGFKNSLETLAELHFKLCECIEMLNAVFTVPLFFEIHIVYGQIIYVCYTYKFMFESILKDYQFILCNVGFTINMLILLTCVYLLGVEVSR